MEKIRYTKRAKQIKRKARISLRRTSSGGGKIPHSGRIVVTITGGNSGKRNKKWSLKRKIDKIKVFKLENPETNNVVLDCKIFLDTNDDRISKKYYQNLLAVLEEYDFILSKEHPAEKGSWIKNFFVKSKKALTSKEVVYRLEKIERGIELKHIDKVQSEVDLNTSKAIANLLDSTKEIPNFSTLVGSLLFAKSTFKRKAIVFAQTLTQEQLKIVKENPSLINKPFDLINKMEDVKVKVLEENKQKKLAGK
ncbi:MAG: hypothetical protein QM486_03105 [Flavobacteriaceae bacterium]